MRFVILQNTKRGEVDLPIFEYETEEKEAQEGLAVIIEVESHQRNIGKESLFTSEANSFDDLEKDEDLAQAHSASEESGVCTLFSEGTLSLQEGLLHLTYIETIEDEEDAGPTKVSLVFPKGSSSHITVSRSGDMNTVFTVEPNVRQYSTYDTPFGQVDLCVIGRKIENNMEETGGTLELDYAVELRGMITQRTKMTIRVRPESEDVQVQ